MKQQIYQPPKKLTSQLKQMDIDLQSIDWPSFGKDGDIEEWLKNEYGIIIPSQLNKAVIESIDEKQRADEVKVVRNEVEKKQKKFENIVKNSNKKNVDYEKVLKALSDYNLHGEDLVVSTLIAISTKRNVINCGQFGTSKSWTTRELMESLKLPFNEINGHQTPKVFFENLELYNNTIVIIDESCNIMSQREILDMLLSALQGSKIRWETTKEKREVEFKGTIIFNTNYMPNSPVLKAVADRCITNIVKLNSNKLKERLQRARTFKFDKNVWDGIKNNLFQKSDINDTILEQLYQIIDNIKVKSMREFDKLKDIADTSLRLTGTLELVKFFYTFKAIDIIINQDKKKKDIVKDISIEKDCSIRQAQRIYKQE